MSNPIVILGIDPATKCGWARLDAAGWTSGAWNLQPRRNEGGGMRYLRLEQHLSEVLATGVGVVVYEEVKRHLGTDAAHVYGAIEGTIMKICDKHVPQIPYFAIPVGTIKKKATGKGNADKAAMLAAARVRWPERQWDDDNEADARWIVEAAIEELNFKVK